MPVRELVATLHRLTYIHKELIELGRQKRDIIVSNDTDQLNQIVLKESRLIKEIAECEQKRQFEVDRYVVGKGYRPNPNITVSEVTKLIFRAEDKKAMLDAQAELAVTIAQLQEINALNRQLIEQSLFFIEYSLNLMTGSADDDAIYTHPGQRGPGHRSPGLFDART